MAKALALISGSLDSQVAAKLAQAAGLELTCAVFECPFQHRTGAVEAAEQLDAPLTGLAAGEDFLDVVRRPRFNFGGGPLSCLECRMRMLTAAREKAKAIGAEAIVTGEVLGQRATNQSRRQLDLIAYHANVKDMLYRPLSASFLEPPASVRQLCSSLPSKNISGSGRRPIRELAKRLGIADLDRPGPQCRLSDPGYMARLDDLLVHQANADLADVKLLLFGRHYRLHRNAKAVVGRNAADNDAITAWHARHQRGKLFVPANFQGASVLLLGGAQADEEITMSLSAGRKTAAPERGFEFREGERMAVLRSLSDLQAYRPIQAV